mgnify:CR=1 FL=1|jgi:uncharacterized membrane protein HdeD (DUF308 family)
MQGDAILGTILFMITWKWFIVEGILLFILGIFAIAQPEIATLTVVELLAWLLIFVGAFSLFGGVTSRSGPRVPSSLVGGIVALVCGIVMLVIPEIVVGTATIIIALFFLLSGFAEISSSFSLRSIGGHNNHWGLAFFNGLISVVLGIVLLTYWPEVAILGLLLGINFLFSGSYLISLGWFFRNAPAH